MLHKDFHRYREDCRHEQLRQLLLREQNDSMDALRATTSSNAFQVVYDAPHGHNVKTFRSKLHVTKQTTQKQIDAYVRGLTNQMMAELATESRLRSRYQLLTLYLGPVVEDLEHLVHGPDLVLSTCVHTVIVDERHYEVKILKQRPTTSATITLDWTRSTFVPVDTHWPPAGAK